MSLLKDQLNQGKKSKTTGASSLLKAGLNDAAAERENVDERIAHEDYAPTQKDSDAVAAIAEKVSVQYRDDISREGLTPEVLKRIQETITDEAAAQGVDYESQKRIETMASAHVTGLGPLEAYINDPNVTEIIVQLFNNICVERNGLVQPTNAAFNDEEHLRTVINRIISPVGRKINLHTPMVDARLPDGSRINATIPPATPDGATLTIRKFPERGFTGEDYIRLRSLSMPMLIFLAKCIEAKISLIVSGGTNSGKTTLLNTLSNYIPDTELIITIEDSCELRLKSPNVRRMETRRYISEGMMPITIQTLVKNALRMRPDRIIVGDIRDGTVVDMMSAMSTGHEGSMSTVHANSPTNLINTRFPILYSMSDASFSDESRRLQIADALQLIVHISHQEDGSRKITHITHVVGVGDNGKIKLENIFLYNKATDTFEATGYIPKESIRRAKNSGITIPLDLFKKDGAIE